MNVKNGFKRTYVSSDSRRWDVSYEQPSIEQDIVLGLDAAEISVCAGSGASLSVLVVL